MNLIASRIKSLCDTLNVSALARCIPSFVCDNYRDTQSVYCVVKLAQLLLKLLKLCLILLICDSGASQGGSLIRK